MMLLPCRLISGSATPRESTRFRMIFTAWPSVSDLTFDAGLGGQHDGDAALEVEAELRGGVGGEHAISGMATIGDGHGQLQDMTAHVSFRPSVRWPTDHPERLLLSVARVWIVPEAIKVFIRWGSPGGMAAGCGRHYRPADGLGVFARFAEPTISKAMVEMVTGRRRRRSRWPAS